MRVIGLILGLFMLLQNSIPCGDVDAIFANVPHGTNIENTAHQSKTVADICPPFCVCACCVTHSIVTQNTNLTLTVSIKTPKNIILNKGKFIDISLPIWQPPKLA